LGTTSLNCVFRHSMATHMLRNRADLHYIQAVLGHSLITSTEIYTHVSLEDLKAVVRRAHPPGEEEGIKTASRRAIPCCPSGIGVVDLLQRNRAPEETMDMILEIHEGVVQALRPPRKGTKDELKRLLAVTLYAKGILGIGKARELAGVSKLEFYGLLKREGIPLNYNEEDLANDISTIKALAV
jgi:predicted HTH domain antitoxin